MIRADLTIKQTKAPLGRWCEGARHKVPRGAKFKNKPTRFFRVAGDHIDMIICEPCLTVAQAMARTKKKRERDGY